MTRCEHKNGEFIEVMTATHARDVVGGKLAQLGINEVGDIHHYEYMCLDCGKYWRADTATSFKRKFINEIGKQLL